MNLYDLDESKQSLIQMEALFSIQVDTQVIMQILLDKGICTREEIKQHRERVKRIPKYKAIDDYLQNAMESMDYYKNNQQEYIRDLFKAKMDGKI